MPRRALLISLALATALTLALSGPAIADPNCTQQGPVPAARAPIPIRFGLTPQAAGSAGATQETPKPADEAKADAALTGLHVPGKALVVRLNRMFWSDGDAGLKRFADLADRYAREGLLVELQVRYHPPAGHAGDMKGWTDYVRKAVQTFAPRRSVVELSITNEANLPISSNTSDGAYSGYIDAIVQGIVAARREADRLGRPDLALGFTYAYRWTNDPAFFKAIGAAATPDFRAALDHVGMQLYPGLFFPPASADVAGDTIKAANFLRTCFFPLAGIGENTHIWITENGYATRGGIEGDQANQLRSTLDALERWSGTYGVTDYRYFNLRDNNSTGSDLFDAVGLLFDDYRPKASYGAFRDTVARVGAAAPAAVRLTVTVTPKQLRRRAWRRVRVRVIANGRPVTGALVRLGRWHARTNAAGVARLRVRLIGRPGVRHVRVTLAGASPATALVRVRSTRRVAG